MDVSVSRRKPNSHIATNRSIFIMVSPNITVIFIIYRQVNSLYLVKCMFKSLYNKVKHRDFIITDMKISRTQYLEDLMRIHLKRCNLNFLTKFL